MRIVAVALTAFLLAVAPAHAAVRTVDRGIVLRVRAAAIVLRELDGSRKRIPVSPQALITLDGRSVPLASLRPGQVAFVVHFGARPALRIRAFSR